jgi:hypothetical protein
MAIGNFASWLGAAALVVAAAAPVRAGDAAKRLVVVELYTSQGCSSCPPADALLGALAKQPGVLAISLPVTYWDMLGWKDTLASEANTRRQKAYARIMGHGGIYTPEMIVDGVDDVVGSRTQQVKAAIAARAQDMPVLPVSLTPDQRTVRVSIAAAPVAGLDKEDLGKWGTPNATIWVFQLLNQATVNIGAGENSGRKVTYHNVVRTLRAVGMWKGQAVSFELPRHDPSDPPHDGLAVVVQQGGYGRVLGAARIARPDYSPSR